MNQPPLFDSVQDLLLHQPPMLLLKSIVKWDETGLEALVDPKDSALFADEHGAVPCWVGIEYMAQAIGAYAGIESRTEGVPLCLGFLLGTRRYSAKVVSFDPEQLLRVKVRELLRDETNLVLFDCQIYADDQLLASAEIKAIQPKDANAVIAHLTQMSQSSGNDK